MSKHRKTRQQKIIADLRRQAQQYTISSPTPLPASASTIHEKKSYQISLQSNQTTRVASPILILNAKYLSYDLAKTVMVTSAILFVQTIIFLLLKNHILQFPFANY